jgi:hypothetical protein
MIDILTCLKEYIADIAIKRTCNINIQSLNLKIYTYTLKHPIHQNEKTVGLTNPHLNPFYNHNTPIIHP